MRYFRILAAAAVTFVMSLMSSPEAAANGDPVIRFSSITSSGNPVPRNIKEVDVASEKLVITPGIPYSTVTVEYVLRNNSSKNFKRIDYGFPIDYHGSKDKRGFAGYEYSESSYEVGWWDENLKDIAFFLDGQQLEWHSAHEVVTPEHKERAWADEAYPEGVEDDDVDMITVPQLSRLWTYTEFSIPAKSSVTLKVTYSFYCMQMSDLYRVGASPYSRYIPNDCWISYDLTPASHWGDGKTTSLEVTIDTSRLPDLMVWRQERRFGGETSVWGSPEMNWEGFVRDGENWVFRAENFSFKDSEPLTVEFREVEDSAYGVTGWKDMDEFVLPDKLYTVKEGKNFVDIFFNTPVMVTDISFLDKKYGRDRKSYIASDMPFYYGIECNVTRADGYTEESYSDYQLFRGYKEDRTERKYVCVTDLETVLSGRWVETEEEGVYTRDASKERKIKHIRINLIPNNGVTESVGIKDIKVYNVR